MAWPSSPPRPRWTTLNLEGDERTGITILRRALEEPLRRIAINAGQDGCVIVQEVKTLPAGQGYDAARDEFGDMLQRGIIDPLKVTRSALENAVSIAGMVLTTNCLVTDIPEGGRRPPRRPCTSPSSGTDTDAAPPLDAVGAKLFTTPTARRKTGRRFKTKTLSA